MCVFLAFAIRDEKKKRNVIDSMGQQKIFQQQKTH